MLRGTIHYILEGAHTGSEQSAGRPAVIVSNDVNNAHSSVVEVVFLTTSPKNKLPTHVTIKSSVKVSIALCEQVTSVSTSRVGDYVGTCSAQEMAEIEKAICTSLAINAPVDTATIDATKELAAAALRIQQLTWERDFYQNRYDEIINKILKGD